MRARGTGLTTADLDEKSKKKKKGGEAEEGEGDETVEGKKKKAATGTKSYVLRNCLPSDVIAALAAIDDENEEGDEEEDDDAGEAGAKDEGAGLEWKLSEQRPLLAVLQIILALILVNDRVLGDGKSMSSITGEVNRAYLVLSSADQLQSHLRRLHVTASVPIHKASVTWAYKDSVDVSLPLFLNQLIQKGYLEKSRSAAFNPSTQGASQATQQRTQATGRSRASQSQRQYDELENADGAGDAAWEWRWGSRSEIEFGEKAIARFIAEVFDKTGGRGHHEGPSRENGAGGGGGKSQASGSQKRASTEQEKKREREMLMKDLERAAGGKLQEATNRRQPE